MEDGVADFERDERRRRHHHQELGPALLQINADTFGAEHERGEERDQSRHLKQPARDHILQSVQEIKHRLAVRHHQFAIHPIGNGIQPARPAVQKEKRNPDS